MKTNLLVILTSWALTGCALTPGLVPGLGGKLTYEVTLKDVASASEGEGEGEGAASNTEFSVKISAPAGTDIKDITSFGYKWDQTGGEMSVNTDKTASTQGQADLLKQVTQSTVDALSLAQQAVQALIAAYPGIIAAQNPPKPPVVTPKLQLSPLAPVLP